MLALCYIEKTLPAKTGKLVFVCMEHEFAWVLVAELDYASISLHECDDVRVHRRFVRGAGGDVVEHLAVQMEIVYRVVFKHVLQVYPHMLAYFQLNLVFSSVSKCHAINGIDLITRSLIN